jgi:hypothetical protein
LPARSDAAPAAPEPLAALEADPAFPDALLDALPVALLEEAVELDPVAGVLVPAHADSALTSATAAVASSTRLVPVFQVT